MIISKNEIKQIERVIGKPFSEIEKFEIPTYIRRREESEEQNFFRAYWATAHGAVLTENGWEI